MLQAFTAYLWRRFRSPAFKGSCAGVCAQRACGRLQGPVRQSFVSLVSVSLQAAKWANKQARPYQPNEMDHDVRSYRHSSLLSSTRIWTGRTICQQFVDVFLNALDIPQHKESSSTSLDSRRVSFTAVQSQLRCSMRCCGSKRKGK